MTTPAEQGKIWMSRIVDEVTLLSELALAEHWNLPEEDKAWSHLQPPSPERENSSA